MATALCTVPGIRAARDPEAEPSGTCLYLFNGGRLAALGSSWRSRGGMSRRPHTSSCGGLPCVTAVVFPSGSSRGLHKAHPQPVYKSQPTSGSENLLGELQAACRLLMDMLPCLREVLWLIVTTAKSEHSTENEGSGKLWSVLSSHGSLPRQNNLDSEHPVPWHPANQPSPRPCTVACHSSLEHSPWPAEAQGLERTNTLPPKAAHSCPLRGNIS